MLHIGKTTRKYVLDGYMEKEWDIFVPYTTTKAYLSKDIGVTVSKDDLKHFSYAHGSYKELLAGKVCVIRGMSIHPWAHGCMWWDDNKDYYYPDIFEESPEKYVLHLVDGGVLIFIGKTSNLNNKVVYKP